MDIVITEEPTTIMPLAFPNSLTSSLPPSTTNLSQNEANFTHVKENRYSLKMNTHAGLLSLQSAYALKLLK